MALTGKFGKECDELLSEAGSLEGATLLYACIGKELAKSSLTRFERQRLTDERARLYELFGSAVREERTYRGKMKKEPSRFVSIKKPDRPGALILLFGGSGLDIEINRTLYIPSTAVSGESRGFEDLEKKTAFMRRDSELPFLLKPDLTPGQFPYPLSPKLFATELQKRAGVLEQEADFLLTRAKELRAAAEKLSRETGPLDDHARRSREETRPTQPGDILGARRPDGSVGRVRRERSDAGIPRKK